MNNEKLKDIAVKVLEKSTVPKDDNYGFAVVTILMVISIILTCIRILQECNKSKLNTQSSLNDKTEIYGEQLKTFSQRRGWFTKMRIKKILRREMKKEDYEKYALGIINGMLDIGETLTEDEIRTLVEAANV